MVSDIEMLRICIDREDDTALPILADALEDAGEVARATGLRRAMAEGKCPNNYRGHDAPPRGYAGEWVLIRGRAGQPRGVVREAFDAVVRPAADRMDDRDDYGAICGEQDAWFTRRSSAFLALANAYAWEAEQVAERAQELSNALGG